jgi:CheY-like chemotaxis protein
VRVLIIDDNVDSADTLGDVLRLDEHEIAVSYSGAEGIDRARAFRPDVVLCDIGLPGMDGYEVARTLRADQDLGDTTLVALSGFALPEDVERARRAGFDRHAAKPLSVEKLRSMLAAVRGERRS